MSIVEDRSNGVLEVGEGWVEFGVEDFFLRELPEALDEVQVWGIRRKKKKLDTERLGCCLNKLAALIAGVVENQGDRDFRRESGDLAEQFANTFRIDVLRIANGNQGMCRRTDGAKNVEPFPT